MSLAPHTDRPASSPLETAAADGTAAARTPWNADGLRLHVLGSGSQGNCCVVESPDGLVLVDAGLSCRQIFVRMEALGLSPADVRAVFVTHEHSDHIAGLRVTAKKIGAPVYASEGTRRSDAWHAAGDVSCEVVRARTPLVAGGVRVTPFHVPHDAAEALGYRFERAGDAIGYCTDLGQVTDEAGEYLSDARILALESNHDPRMLAAYDGYPAYLKSRIAGNAGHLSNDQAASALPDLVTSTTQVIVGMHISQHTNLPSAAREALVAGQRAAGDCAQRTRVMIAGQASPFSCV